MNTHLTKTLTYLLTMTVSLSLAAAITPEDGSEFDSIMSGLVTAGGPGCGLGIIRDGELVYNRGYGLADMEHDVPISPDTVFRTGSVGKQFTAASIAILAVQGLLDLDADIHTLLPDLPEYPQTVTVRHLLSHSAGIPNVYDLIELLGHETDGNFYPSELILEMIYRLKTLEFEPGSKFEYSNAAYLLLAQIVEAVSGKSLRAFAHDNIFVPLGMSNTHFHDDYREIVKNRAYGHGLNADGQWELRNSNFYLVGDGGVFTTVADLARWDQNFYDNQLAGGKNLIELMEEPYEYTETGAKFMAMDMDYGFGLFVGEYQGQKIVWHTGGWAGFAAVVARFPEKNRSLIMLCNQRKRIGETFKALVAKILEN